MINAVFNIYWPETAKLPSHTLFVFVDSTLIHIANFLGVHDYPRALKATLQPITRALKTDIRDKKTNSKFQFVEHWSNARCRYALYRATNSRTRIHISHLDRTFCLMFFFFLFFYKSQKVILGESVVCFTPTTMQENRTSISISHGCNRHWSVNATHAVSPIKVSATF